MFNRATRQNFLAAPVIAYLAGTTQYSLLPKVGLLKRIILLFTGVQTITLGGGTAVLGAEAPFSLLTRLRITANGNTALFDMSGYGGMIQSLFAAYGFAGFGGRPRIVDGATVPGPASAVFSALNFAAGVSAGANTWNFAIEIPLGLSDDWRDPIGLILAAAPDTVLQVEATWGNTLFSTVASRTTPVLVTGAATAALTAASLTPYVEFFTIPRSEADYPDLRRIHTWSEQGPSPILNQDNDVVLQRGNTLQRIVHGVWTNSAPDATNVISRQLRFNQSEVPYFVSRQLDAFLVRERMVRDLPDGWGYVWDLWNTTSPRDAINTLNLNDLTSRVTVSGATIAGTTDVRTLTEQLILLTGAAGGSN